MPRCGQADLAAGELKDSSKDFKPIAGEVCQYSITSSRPPFISERCALSSILTIFKPLSPSLIGAEPSRMELMKC
jgi:hypothetical protein